MEAINQILLDENVGGKGRHFSTRFLQAGLVKYSFGVCLLDKETIDKFIYNFVGCPVIINHKDVTQESAKDDRVGVISRVWFNEQDGWYWGEGVIFEQEALDLIDNGYNVSCQYEITEYSSTGGLHNGNNYDKIILNGKPEHLAIVKNPRYENALISVNSMDLEAINEDDFKQLEDKNGDKYTVNLGYEKELKKILNNLNINIKSFTNKGNYNIEISIDSIELNKKLHNIKKVFGEKNIKNESIDECRTLIKINTKDFFNEQNNKRKEKTKKKKEEKSTQLHLFNKNDIIQAINEIKGTNMFMNLFKKKEKNMDKEEMKNLFMECLTELTASNEAKEEAKEDKTDWKKLYNDLKAEIEAKKEDKEDKEEKKNDAKEEVAENKCDKAKNEMEAQKEAILGGVKSESKITYITEAKSKELGKELF